MTAPALEAARELHGAQCNCFDQDGSRPACPQIARIAAALTAFGAQEFERGGGCKWCANGDAPKLLDKDGTLVSVSKQPGTWCHSQDDYWWPCVSSQRAASEFERGREAGLEEAAQLMTEGFGWPRFADAIRALRSGTGGENGVKSTNVRATSDAAKE